MKVVADLEVHRPTEEKENGGPGSPPSDRRVCKSYETDYRFIMADLEVHRPTEESAIHTKML